VFIKRILIFVCFAAFSSAQTIFLDLKTNFQKELLNDIQAQALNVRDILENRIMLEFAAKGIFVAERESDSNFNVRIELLLRYFGGKKSNQAVEILTTNAIIEPRYILSTPLYYKSLVIPRHGWVPSQDLLRAIGSSIDFYIQDLQEQRIFDFMSHPFYTIYSGDGKENSEDVSTISESAIKKRLDNYLFMLSATKTSSRLEALEKEFVSELNLIKRKLEESPKAAFSEMEEMKFRNARSIIIKVKKAEMPRRPLNVIIRPVEPCSICPAGEIIVRNVALLNNEKDLERYDLECHYAMALSIDSYSTLMEKENTTVKLKLTDYQNIFRVNSRNKAPYEIIKSCIGPEYNKCPRILFLAK